MEHENRYPHLDDTEFPDVETVDVYEYENEYDYSRWTDNVRIKLCNVPWESDGSNAVKFDNEEERDKWFDNLEGETKEFPSMFHEMPKQNVKVPVPFPVAMTYNYVVVDIPVMPTEGLPLEFESSKNRYKRTFWFILDVQSTAPNTTELVLMQDYWTNYVNSVEIPFMMLRRGHAPMSKTSVEKYLTDPMHNNDYLLAPDVSYGRESIAHSQKWFPFGNGTKFLCVACTMPLDKFITRAYQTTPSINSTPVFEDMTENNLEVSPWSVWTQPVPSWSEYTSGRPDGTSPNATRSERIMQDYDITEWRWALGNQDYHDTTVHIDHLHDMGVHSGVSVYAILSTDAEEFLNQMDTCYPQWYSTVLGAFDVSGDMFEIKRTVTVLCESSFTVYEVRECEGLLGTINLKKADFKYSSRYADITKLYTFPYSWLELQDDSGRVVEVHVEELSSNAELKFKTSMAFPWINYNAFFEGIGGDGNPAVFEWRNVNGTDTEMNIECSDWRRLMFSHSIPVFALYQQAERRWGCENAGTIEYGRLGAMTKYRNADDGANTSQWNERDMALVTEANKIDAADAQYNAAVYTANATATNEKNNAQVDKDNIDDSTAQAQKNVGYACTAERKNQEKNSRAASDMLKWSDAEQGAAVWYDLQQQRSTLNYNLDASFATTMINGVAGVVAGAIGGTAGGSFASGGGITPHGQLGAIAGVGVGAVNMLSSSMCFGFTASKDVNIFNASCEAAVNKLNNAVNYSGLRNFILNGVYLTDSGATVQSANVDMGVPTTISNDPKDGVSYWVTDNACDAKEKQAKETKEVNQANAKRTCDNVKGASGDVGTADRMKNARINAAAAIRDSEKRRAARHRYRDYNNRIATQNTLTRQAKRTMIQDRRDLETGFVDAAHSMPVTCGQYIGDASDDVMKWRGLQVKVRTQTDSAIAQAGDQMLRYGYMVNQSWDFDGFNVMPKFTYWEVEDLWLFGGEKGIPEDGQEYIKSMLKKGVTVWHNPDDMGRYSIYENR